MTTSGRRISLAVAVPLGVVVLAYALWWLSDRLLYVGPFDRATFGWGVVIPVWLASPVVAAFAWRTLASGQQDRASLLFGSIVAAGATLLFWQAIAFPDCGTAPSRTPLGWLPLALALGAAVGGGLAISGRAAASAASEGHALRAAMVGAGLELLFVFGTILIGGMLLVASPACQRPAV
jgi:hypothetical protein